MPDMILVNRFDDLDINFNSEVLHKTEDNGIFIMSMYMCCLVSVVWTVFSKAAISSGELIAFIAPLSGTVSQTDWILLHIISVQ